MRKQLYQAIIAQLSLIQVNNQDQYITAAELDSSKSAIKHFAIWNNQLQYLADEQPFPLPAVFLQFNPILWEQRSKGIRAADVSLTLHVITRHIAGGSQSLTQPNIAFFDLLDAINANLYGLRADFFRNLVSTSSATDHNHAELIDSQETYTVQLTDHSAMRPILKAAPQPIVNTSFQ